MLASWYGRIRFDWHTAATTRIFSRCARMLLTWTQPLRSFLYFVADVRLDVHAERDRAFRRVHCKRQTLVGSHAATA